MCSWTSSFTPYVFSCLSSFKFSYGVVLRSAVQSSYPTFVLLTRVLTPAMTFYRTPSILLIKSKHSQKHFSFWLRSSPFFVPSSCLMYRILDYCNLLIKGEKSHLKWFSTLNGCRSKRMPTLSYVGNLKSLNLWTWMSNCFSLVWSLPLARVIS